MTFTESNQLLDPKYQSGSYRTGSSQHSGLQQPRPQENTPSAEDQKIAAIKNEIVEKEKIIDRLLGYNYEDDDYTAEYAPSDLFDNLVLFNSPSDRTVEKYTKKLNALKSILAYKKDGSIDIEKTKENSEYLLNATSADNLAFLFKLRDRIDNRGNAGDTNLLSENVQKLSKDIQEVNKTANHALDGISLAVAMANLPTVSSEYNHNISASYGTYAGSHSFALGLSGHIANDRLSYKLSGAVNTKGNLAFGVGVGVNLGKKNQSNKELLDRIEKLENLVKQLQNK